MLKEEGHSRTVGVYFTHAQNIALREFAKREGRPISQTIRILVLEGLLSRGVFIPVLPKKGDAT